MISITAELGKIGFVANDLGTAYINQHTALVRPQQKKSNGAFLAHYLSSPRSRKKLNRLNDSGAKSGLNLSTIRSFKAYVPTLEEQKKIADFLGAVDDKIAGLRERESLLTQYKKGVMQKIFSQEIRFKADDGSDFPDWDDNLLSEKFEIRKGKQLNRSDMILGAKIPVINGGVNPSGYTNESNCRGGIITISEGGNSCGYVNWQKEPFWLGGHCYALEPIGKIVQKFTYQLLSHYQKPIMRLRVGSGLPNIQKGDLHKLKLYFPSCPEQQKIADFLSVIDDKITAVSAQITQMQDFKKGLLQQMFV